MLQHVKNCRSIIIIIIIAHHSYLSVVLNFCLLAFLASLLSILMTSEAVSPNVFLHNLCVCVL